MADGHVGIWAALGEQQPTAAEQRCWNHRVTNVLDAIPKECQAAARTLRCAMPYTDTQAACEQLRAPFDTCYRELVPKAVERLEPDGERLITFYQFPREHWRHLRTTNVVASPFAAVRLRITAAKRFKSRHSANLMACLCIKCLIGVPPDSQPWSVLILNMAYEGALPRNASQVEATKVLEHPAGGGVLSWLSLLAWEGGVGVRDSLPDTIC